MTCILLQWFIKLVHGLSPNYIIDVFTNVDRIGLHQHNTRHSQKLFIEAGRTTLQLKSFEHRGAILWNALPDRVRHSPSLYSFNRAWHKLLRETVIPI